VSQRHTRMGSEGLIREQEDLEVRGGFGIANPFGSIISSQESTISSSIFLSRRSPSKTTSYHGDYSFGYLPPAAIMLGKPLSSSMGSHHRRAFLFIDPIATGLHFPCVLLHNQSYPKVCPVLLNLPNAGDYFAGISSLTSCHLFFPNQGLDCYVLESSRVFFVKFPKLSVFQISELLHFIDFRRKFIKM
jgi:hypothetical protein